MKTSKLSALLGLIISTGCGHAALVAELITNNSGISAVTVSSNIATGGDTTHTYTYGLVADGVSFDVSFDMEATGGFLRGNSSTIGIHSSTVAEASNGAGRNQVNSGEVLLFDNITISNEVGGTVAFDGILRLHYNVADESADSGTVTIGATILSWNRLNGDAPYEDADEVYDVLGAYTNAGGTGDIDSFSVTATGDDFRFGGIEMAFTGTAVPEPSSTALLGLGGLALMLRRRRG